MSFVDELTIKIQSGEGGSGCLSFSSSRRRILGGPDGGDGGSGGCVFVQVNPRKFSLNHLKKIYKASPGKPGQSQKRKGKKGEDLILEVPQNTRIDLNQKTLFPKTKHLLLKGGRGGRGNVFFKTSTNPSPRKFEKGKKGLSQTIHLETILKSDVVFIGWIPILFEKEFFKFKKSQDKILFSHHFPRVQLLTPSIEKEFSIMELPYLKKGSSFLKHALASKLLVFTLVLKEWNEFKKEYENIFKTLQKNQPSLLQKKKICFLVADYNISKSDQKKIHSFLEEKKIQTFSNLNLLKDFIEKNI